MQNKSLKSSEVIYRVARKGYALWRPVELIGNERFDSTNKKFNTLYCAKEPFVCFLETLQVFRSGMHDQKRNLSLILDKPIEEISETESFSSILSEWCEARSLFQITLEKSVELLDVTHHETIQFLRNQRSIQANMQFSEMDFDLSTVTGPNRPLTQQISQIAYQEGFNGLYYTSRFGANLECYAVFSNIHIKQIQEFTIGSSSDDYQEALKTFGLK